MDSMRNLHTSLPSTSSPRRQRRTKAPPKGALLEAFRAAALSVTNLYKTSERERDSIYDSGYQDALSDLLAFLDKENLGLGDGEGWQVRQWATERYISNGSAEGSGGESEEDEEQRARSSSPTADRKEEAGQEDAGIEASSPVVEVVPQPQPVIGLQASHNPIAVPSRVDFTFQSPHVYPAVTDSDMNSSDSVSSHHPASSTSQRNRALRSTRNNARPNNRPSSNMSIGSLGTGAGVKRKPTFPDFFGIQGFPGEGKDGFFGGGKRGRFA